MEQVVAKTKISKDQLMVGTLVLNLSKEQGYLHYNNIHSNQPIDVDDNQVDQNNSLEILKWAQQVCKFENITLMMY
jgi:hypothetical protein